MPGEPAKEFRILHLAARRPLAATDADALRQLIASTPDWSALIAGAIYHRVVPLVHRNLAECGSPLVPSTVIEQLHRHSLTQTQRCLIQIAEISRLSGLFADAGVRFLVLKGVALSMQLYSDAGTRGAGDIDLLVSPDDFWRAEATLTAVGYRPEFLELSPGQRQTFMRWIKELKFVHVTSGAVIELHHRLTANPHLLASDFETLWRERASVSVGDVTIDTLAAHRLPLYLCAHGAGHCWERLRWLADFAEALRTTDVTATLGDAAATGLRPLMLHSLELSHRWLGLPVETTVLTQAQDDRRSRLLEGLSGRFSAGMSWTRRSPEASWEWLRRYSLWLRLYNLSLKPGWRYRAHQLGSDWIMPSDWNAARLPDGLRWLYPIIRPFKRILRRLSLKA